MAARGDESASATSVAPTVHAGGLSGGCTGSQYAPMVSSSMHLRIHLTSSAYGSRRSGAASSCASQSHGSSGTRYSDSLERVVARASSA